MEQQSLRLMQALQARGHSLSLISLHSLGPLAPQLGACEIDAIGLDYENISWLKLILRLRSELRRMAPDSLLLTGHSLPVLLGVIGHCRGRRLLTIHFHHFGVKPSWFWSLYYTIAARLCCAVTFPSDYVRREAEKLCPFLQGKSFTLRNPITNQTQISPEVKQAARVLYGLSSTGAIIGNAGWLIPRKRFDVFLRTAALILQSRPDTCFLIAGDGPDRQNLLALADELGIRDSVVWTGWVDNMHSVYAALDLLLFNSDWDAMGLTPIEAIVHGVPVVSSVLHGGLSEVLRPDVDAVVLDRHDVSKLAQTVVQLLDDPIGTASMVEQARDHLLALCDPVQLAQWHESALMGDICR